jgi:hypothetical protein
MKKIILSAIILLISTLILKSQVTIGSIAEPGKAALLDLKTKAPGSDNVTVDVGKPGGLILPRVQLADLNTLQPFIDLGSSEWAVGTVRDNNMKWHAGMMVYNLTDNALFKPGIYFWDGNEWVAAKSTASATAVTANNGLTKTGDNIQLGGALSKTTTVTTGNYDLDFLGGLKIDNKISTKMGRVFMNGTKTNFPVQTTEALGRVAALGIDTLNGEILTMRSSVGSTTKAINYVVYQLQGEGDYVLNFNTRISTSAYTVVVVGSSFKTKSTYGGIWPAARNGGIPAESIPDYATAISNVFADKYEYDGSGNKTIRTHWHIHADYVGASPSNNPTQGTWTIYCLVINNSLVNIFNDAEPIIKGNNSSRNIDAVTAPTGMQ